ncbi:MFS transporter [Phytohabitans aurantiacus]|uniref:MFS transporter n=1 Tax=Phytohabitans aurantiacus TaxID=3016789 RepID=A0ABQ5R812_9ACTN|nr:MFS transporter [Phytohabitans aurantiacus]GLI02904.1 hypothetical protein Pa4123_81820 [Phytohabitans aurantiacus]
MIEALRLRDFRLLWLARLVSLLGSWLLIVAVPAYVFALTGSLVATGLTLAAEFLPSVLLGPIAGVLADRWDRRSAMLATPGPWEPRLETRWGTGGASCIDLNPRQDSDNELFLTYAPDNPVSPHTQLDADLDFIAHARTDVPKLIAEVRRLRAHPDQNPTVSG